MNLAIDVQYRTKPDDESIYRAAFNLSDPEAQMTAYVEDVVRSAVNKLTLNEVYREKTAISDKVKNQLEQIMKDFGYEIVSAPIVDLTPADHAVLIEMNRVLELEKQWGAQANVNAQLKQRIVFSAEAEKVKSIESGKGVADKRRAIVDGLRESVSTFKDGVQGVSAKDVLELILMTQYFDMLKDVGSRGSSTLFLKHGPGAVTDITADIKTGFETANQMIGK